MINVNNILCSIKHTPRIAKQCKLDRKHKFLDSHPFMMDCQFCQYTAIIPSHVILALVCCSSQTITVKLPVDSHQNKLF